MPTTALISRRSPRRPRPHRRIRRLERFEGEPQGRHADLAPARAARSHAAHVHRAGGRVHPLRLFRQRHPGVPVRAAEGRAAPGQQAGVHRGDGRVHHAVHALVLRGGVGRDALPAVRDLGLRGARALQARKALRGPLVFSSIALFYSGMAFAYFLVFPGVFQFLVSITPKGVEMMTDIGKYVSFAMTMFISFGIAFEVPIVVILLVLTKMISIQKLTASRGYVIIAIFFVSAIITPTTDAVSQLAMAGPCGSSTKAA
jgi:hypothetical protein